METIRVGILGSGGMGTFHAEAYRNIEGVEVIGLTSRDAEKAKKVAKDLGTQGFTDPYELINDPTVTAIDVCVPSSIHREFVIASLEAGKDVFCETPFALNIEDAEVMIQTAQKSKRTLLVGLLMRSISQYRYIKDLVDSGEAGQIKSLEAYRLGSYLLEGGFDAKDHYGDPSTELMTFDFDFANWILGKPNSLTATTINTDKGTPGKITATLDYENDVTATIIGSGIEEVTKPYTIGFKVVFEKGVYELKTVFENYEPKNTFTYQPNGEAIHLVQVEEVDPYKEELKYFIETIKGEKDGKLLDAKHALEALKLSLATQQSLKENKHIAL